MESLPVAAALAEKWVSSPGSRSSLVGIHPTLPLSASSLTFPLSTPARILTGLGSQWQWLPGLVDISHRISSHLGRCAGSANTSSTRPQSAPDELHTMDQRAPRPLIHNPNHQSSPSGPPPAQPTVYQPPSSQQPPVQIPFSDPFSQRRAPDPFLPNTQSQRRGSYGLSSGREPVTSVNADRNPLAAPWPPTSGTYIPHLLLKTARSYRTTCFAPLFLSIWQRIHGFKQCFRLVGRADSPCAHRSLKLVTLGVACRITCR